MHTSYMCAIPQNDKILSKSDFYKNNVFVVVLEDSSPCGFLK